MGPAGVGPTNNVLIETVGNRIAQIIDVDHIDIETMQGAAHNLVHQLELRFFPQLNAIFFEDGWNYKLEKDLVVEVINQQQCVIFVFFKLQTTRPVNIEDGKNHRAGKDDNQAGKRKIFHQSERFALLPPPASAQIRPPLRVTRIFTDGRWRYHHFHVTPQSRTGIMGVFSVNSILCPLWVYGLFELVAL